MKKLLSFVFAFSLIATGLAQKNAIVPTKWLGPNSNGFYPDKGLLEKWPADGPKMIWHYDQLGIGHSSPVFANGKIYTQGMEGDRGFLYVLSESGKLLKKVEYGKEWSESFPGSRSTPTVAGKLIYVYSAFGVLKCIEDETWNVKWEKDIFKDFGAVQLKWGVTETPVVDGDKVYITPGGTQHNVVALNRFTGKTIWSCKAMGEKSAYCTPTLIKLPARKLLVTMTQNHVIGIDAKTGKLLWAHEHKNRWSVHPNTPQYHDGAIIYLSGYNSGAGKLKLSKDGSSVQKEWYSPDLNSQMGSVIVKDGYVYGSGQNKNRGWQALDWKTGEQKFFSKTIAKGVIISADGKLYCYTEKGELALVNPTPEKWDIVSQTKITLGSAQHWAYPVIRNKKLYIRHGEVLMAFDIAK